MFLGAFLLLRKFKELCQELRAETNIYIYFCFSKPTSDALDIWPSAFLSLDFLCSAGGPFSLHTFFAEHCRQVGASASAFSRSFPESFTPFHASAILLGNSGILILSRLSEIFTRTLNPIFQGNGSTSINSFFFSRELPELLTTYSENPIPRILS